MQKTPAPPSDGISLERTRRMFRRAWVWMFLLVCVMAPAVALAQRQAAKKDEFVHQAAQQAQAQFSSDGITSRPLILIIALAAMTLLPFVLLMVTSFVKISVVLSIVRSALGTQQIPPTQVITGLAIILTVYIMAPTGIEMYRAGEMDILKTGQLMSPETVQQLIFAANRSKEPLRNFLAKKVTTKDKALFFGLAKKMRQEEDRKDLADKDFMVLVPAFVVSELKEAFQIGFILFVPFIVIDMVVANILLALGMHMLSPTTISMPFKLLLFVMVDGWYLIAKGLVVGYLMNQLVFITQEALYLVLVCSAPPVVISLIVGMIVAIFQATTQIQEQTLTFAPKMIVVFGVLAFLGSWMGSILLRFTFQVFDRFPEMLGH